MKDWRESNLAYLRHFSGDLYAKFSSMDLPASMRLVEAKSGVPTLQALRSDGTDVLVHSAYDPTREAAEFVASKGKEKTDACAVVGFGLGYHVVEFVRHLPRNKWLIVIEARDDVFRAALEAADLSPVFTRERTRIFVGHTLTDFLGWLKTFLDDSNIDDVSVIMHPPSVSLLPEFYRHVISEMRAAVNRRAVEVATLVRQAKMLEENAVRNLAAVARSAGVNEFAGAFSGIPMIVVGAGPSLAGNLEHLRKIKGRAVIICVGKVLKLLLSEGIRPEFTANLDMHSSSLECFRNPGDLRGTALVYDPDSYHEIVGGYHGDLVTFETIVPVSKWFVRFSCEKGFLEKGLSVAHTAFFFARATGADPIILVGVDLAFIGEQTHVAGATQTWGGKVADLQLEMIDLPAARGGTVKGARSFQSFVSAFEVEIGKTKSRVINCTEGGALIRGAQHRDFASVVEEYCVRSHPIETIVGGILARERRFDREGFLKTSDNLLAAADRIAGQCRQSQGWIRRVSRLDPTNKYDQQEYKKLAAKVNEARTAVLRETEVLPLLQRLVSDAALYIKTVTKALEGVDPADTREKTRLEVERMSAFFKAYEEAALFFAGHLRDVSRAIKGKG